VIEIRRILIGVDIQLNAPPGASDPAPFENHFQTTEVMKKGSRAMAIDILKGI
jgi:hypothetical protein